MSKKGKLIQKLTYKAKSNLVNREVLKELLDDESIEFYLTEDAYYENCQESKLQIVIKHK